MAEVTVFAWFYRLSSSEWSAFISSSDCWKDPPKNYYGPYAVRIPVPDEVTGIRATVEKVDAKEPDAAP